MVGVSRLELLTSRSQSARATNCAKPRLLVLYHGFRGSARCYNKDMGEFLSKRKRLICILAPTVFGIFYMFISMFNLQQSVWQGESYGAYLTHYNAAQIWEFTAETNQPPLYFWTLKVWAHLFGHTDFAMRFMSVFFGALAIMFAYMWVKYKYGARAAILSSLLLSISPVFIRYGQEMQAYTMATMFVFAGTYFLQLAIDNGQKRWWWIYALIVALGMWTSYFTVFAWLAHVVYLTLIYGKKLLQNKVLWVFVGALLLFLPWLPKLFTQLSIRGANANIISLQNMVDSWSEILVYRGTAQISGAILILILISTLVLLSLIGHSIKKVRLLLCMILTPTILLILLSLTPFGIAMTPQRCLYSVASVALIGGVTTIILTNEREQLLMKRRKKEKVCLCQKPNFVFASCSILFVLCSISGIFSLHELGNYNFETDSKYGIKQLYQDIVTADGSNKLPIIVNDPDLYYDLSFYDGNNNYSYILAENIANYDGRYLPLKDTYFGKIVDLDKFLEKNKEVWYVGVVPAHGEIEFPRSGYRAQQIVTLGTDESGVAYEAVHFVPE